MTTFRSIMLWTSANCYVDRNCVIFPDSKERLSPNVEHKHYFT